MITSWTAMRSSARVSIIPWTTPDWVGSSPPVTRSAATSSSTVTLESASSLITRSWRTVSASALSLE